MSDNDNFRPVRRAWATKEADSLIHCYLGMERRISLRELVNYLAKHYDHVDPWEVQLNFATATWEEPATAEDRATRSARQASHDARHAQWEREIYAELKVKFESREAGQ